VIIDRNGASVELLLDEDDEARLPGKVSIGSHGYAQIWLVPPVRRMELLHRWVLGLRPGDGLIGDHRDRNRLDCRRSNLRIVDPSASASNVSARGISGALGVYPTRSGRWIARGHWPNYGGAAHLGTFATVDEAAAVAHAWRVANLPGYIADKAS
jgi:hypothetical protein